MFSKTSESMEYISFLLSATGLKMSNTEENDDDNDDDTFLCKNNAPRNLMEYCNNCK
jgi:hypothetical protein